MTAIDACPSLTSTSVDLCPEVDGLKLAFGRQAARKDVEFCDRCGSVCTPECFSAAVVESTRLWSFSRPGSADMADLREQVRDHYAEAARTAKQGASCCGPECCGSNSEFGGELYDIGSRADVPDTALLASLGCGNPTAVAELQPGETVLDLGSGGGIDVILSARRVGPTGKVYGLDMTDDMLALALENKAKAEADNVEFLKGYIEQIPLPAGTVDVVISNCVINLSIDKPAVFSEIARVLKPGGRIGISDVVAGDELSPRQRAERGDYVGCLAGALSFSEYETMLRAAGFKQVSIEATHEVTGGMFAAIVKGTLPVGG